jgi:hypothetical protein
MSIDLKVIINSDIPEILNYEENRLIEQGLPEDEIKISAWSAPWRKEALEHYVPLGWSFIARDVDGRLLGYFLAQPILFFDRQTQSLWVEHLQASSLLARDALTDLAYRLSREKHLQRVYFPNLPHIHNAIAGYKPELWGSQSLLLKTTKA